MFKDDLTTLYIVWTLVKTSTNTDHVRTTRQPFKTFNQQAQTLNQRLLMFKLVGENHPTKIARLTRQSVPAKAPTRAPTV